MEQLTLFPQTKLSKPKNKHLPEQCQGACHGADTSPSDHLKDAPPRQLHLHIVLACDAKHSRPIVPGANADLAGRRQTDVRAVISSEGDLLHAFNDLLVRNGHGC